MSPSVQDKDGNQFITVEPEDCSGMAREVEPPFIFDLDPAATDGGHWVADDGRQVVVEEMVGVYHADFDPKRALAEARRTIESCRDVPFTVTNMRGREYHFRLLPQVNSGSPDIVLWSFTATTGPVTTHSSPHTTRPSGSRRVDHVNGYDVLSLARDALERIEKLANTTA